MVIFSRLLTFFFLVLSCQIDGAPLVEASVDPMHAHPHYPIEGIITITHKKEEKIDPDSFTIDGKKMQVSLTREVLMSASSDTLVAIYNFQLPAEGKGLYVLPEISVMIGNQRYSSVPSSYEVNEETSLAPASTPSSNSPLIFKLEATVQGPSTLYPGERTKLFYKISYNRSVDLTRSDLPMIHPPHFQKVGDVQIKDYQEQDVTVQELTQEVEASDIGTFQLGPSLIEGYAYTMEGIQKIYDTSLLQAKAPTLTIEVKPFPPVLQPPSFNGAIGQIQVEASLQSPSSVSVGDTVQLLIKAKGIANLEDLKFPILQCQPGFSGFFQTSDLPPSSEVKEDTKLFNVEIRPATSLIQQVPPIEFSSFDPSTGKYVVQKTASIPLTVAAHPGEKEPSLRAPLPHILAEEGTWPKPSLSPLEFEIEPIPEKENLARRLTSGDILWLLPLGIALLLCQWVLKKRWQNRPKKKTLNSEELLAKACQLNQSKRREALFLLEQACWHHLWEKHVLEEGDYHLEKLPQNELSSFLYRLQELQYSRSQEFDFAQVMQTAQRIIPI